MPRAVVHESASRLRLHVPPRILRLLLSAPILFGMAALLTLKQPAVAVLACEETTCTISERWILGVQARSSEFPVANLMEAQTGRTLLYGRIPSEQVILAIGGEPRPFPGFVDPFSDKTRMASAIHSWIKRPVGRLEVVAGDPDRALILAGIFWLACFVILARLTHSWTLVMDRKSGRVSVRWPGNIGHEVRTLNLRDVRDARPRYGWRQWYVELHTFEGRFDGLGGLPTEQEAAALSERLLRYRRAVADVPLA